MAKDFVDLPQPVLDPHQDQQREHVARAQRRRAAEQPRRLLLAPELEADAAIGVVGVVMLGLERDRALIGPLRLVEPPLGHERQAARDMGRGQRRLQLERQLGRGDGLLDRERIAVVQGQAGLAFRDPGMGPREIAVEIDGLGEQAARDLVGVPGAPAAELLAAEIELVGVDVAGRRLAAARPRRSAAA